MFTFSQSTSWKPRDDILEQQQIDLPYKPFLRTDRLGKVVDFSSSFQKSARETVQQVETEAAFQAVDTKQPAKKALKYKGQPAPRRVQQPQQRRVDQRRKTNTRTERASLKILKTFAVEPDVYWKILSEYSLITLSKFSKGADAVSKESNYCDVGRIRYYDKAADSVSTRSRRPLPRHPINPPNVSASNDPIFQRMASENVADVFIGSDVLTMLMTSNRSVIPFDIVTIKKDGKYWFDKRSEFPLFDLQVVDEHSETAPFQETGPDSPLELFSEVKNVSDVVRDTLLAGEEVTIGSSQDLDAMNLPHGASYGYRYKIFELTTGTRIAVRFPLMGRLGTASDHEETYVRTLYEWHSLAGINSWRNRLDKKKGAVLSEQLHDNNNQLSRWALEGLLGDVPRAQIAFVSRSLDTKSSAPELLATLSTSTAILAQQLNISLAVCWSTVLVVLEEIGKLSQGVHVILRPASKNCIRIFDVPNATSAEDVHVIPVTSIIAEEEDEVVVGVRAELVGGEDDDEPLGGAGPQRYDFKPKFK
ncbi:hypothetical protein RCL1_007779 [Eukaryota sp. TZLM3-RCL]